MNLLESLRAFMRVAEYGNFSRAAKQIGVTQSNLSKQVAALEEHLDVRLLSRTTRRLKLTAEGVTYLRYARRILDYVEEAEGQVGRSKSTASGLVRVGSPYAFAQRHLVERVGRLLDRYPRMKIEIAVSDLTPSLIEQEIDIAVRLGELSGELVGKRIGTASRVAVASPGYLKRCGTPKTPDDLARHECLVFTNPTIDRGWTFDWPDGRTTINVSGSFRSNSAQLIKEACLAGRGIAVMPEWLFDQPLRSGELVRVLRKFEPQGIPVSLVHTSRRYVPFKTRVVFDFLFAELRKELNRAAVEAAG